MSCLQRKGLILSFVYDYFFIYLFSFVVLKCPKPYVDEKTGHHENFKGQESPSKKRLRSPRVLVGVVYVSVSQ